MLQPDVDAMAAAPASFQIHTLVGMVLFAIWPFTRLVHAFTAPLHYLFRPYIVYRSRDARPSPGTQRAAAGLGARRHPRPRPMTWRVGDVTSTDAPAVTATAQTRNLALATWTFAITFWAWNLIGPLAARYTEQIGLVAHPEVAAGRHPRARRRAGPDRQPAP